MPLYFFDIAQGDFVEEDHQGQHAADLNAAREIAARSADDLLKAEGKISTEARIEIRNADREWVATVPVDLSFQRPAPDTAGL